MGTANLDLVRSIYAKWERGDLSSAEWAHPEIEYVMADGPEPGRTALAQMAKQVREFLSAWEELRVGADEYRELDNDRVLVLDHRTGHGKASGVELGKIGANGAHLFHVRDEKVTRIVRYWDRERAFADLGLKQEGDAADELETRGSVE